MVDRTHDAEQPRVIPAGAEPPGEQPRSPSRMTLILIVAGLVILATVATAVPAPTIRWAQATPPQGRLNAPSVISTPTGFSVLAGPRSSDRTSVGVVWSTTDGGEWLSRPLPRLSLRIVHHDRGLYVLDRRSLTRIGPDGDDPIGTIELPEQLRIGSGSGDVGLVAAFDGLLAQTVRGDVLWSPDGRDFELAVEASRWGADADVTPPPSDVSEVARDRVSSVCRPRASVAPDVPPIVETSNRLIALVPQDDPSVVWPACEPVLWRSFEGADWEPLTEVSPFPDAAHVYDAAWRDGRFIAVGGIGFDNTKVWTSPDGDTWSEIADLVPAEDADITRVEAGGAGWVVVATPRDGSAPIGWFSSDGECWEALPDGIAGPGIAVGDDHVMFVTGDPARVSIGTPTDPTWPIRRCA